MPWGNSSDEDRAAAEAILARVEAARQAVEETAALAAHVQQAYQQAPRPRRRRPCARRFRRSFRPQ